MDSDFKESFSGVASAFGVKVDDGRAFIYQKTFKHLNEQEWQSLCEWAIQTCDRFPTIKELWRGMYELGMVKRPRLSELDKDAATVVCTCGSSFVFSLNAPPAEYHCPGDNCHVSYHSHYVRQNMDQYNVLWADVDIRAALHNHIPKAKAMEMIYDLLTHMHKDTAPKTLKELRALPTKPAPEAMFSPKFDGKDARPNPYEVRP